MTPIMLAAPPLQLNLPNCLDNNDCTAVTFSAHLDDQYTPGTYALNAGCS